MKSQYFIQFHFFEKGVNGIGVRFFGLKYSRLCYKNYILLLLNIWFAAQRTTYNQSHAHHANLLFFVFNLKQRKGRSETQLFDWG